MEDPWANAWGESSKSKFSDTLSTSSAWSAPSVSAIHGDHEDDLSLPSWSAQPDVQWTDPDNAGTALWTSDTSTVWNPTPSTFDQISLTDQSNHLPNNEPQSLSPPPPDAPKSSPPPSPPQSITPDDEHIPISPSSSSPRRLSVIEPPPPFGIDAVDDVDAFGTFETAHDEVNAQDWPSTKPTYSLPSNDTAEVWGGAWGTPTAEPPDTHDNPTITELDDAWEAARQQKEKQDRHVPPELLASIIQEFRTSSDDLWPDSALSSDIRDDQRPMDMEEHLGLGPLVQRLIPEDLILPPSVSFSTTFISKQLSEALKMTRHAPLTRFSPMAFYMSSKGLTSWEASVKARPNILPDDIVIPVGWKILENPKAEVTTDDPKKKPNGGLLSFFGRRATNPVDNAPAARSASPASVSATSSARTGASPRPSVDSIRPASVRSHRGGSTAPSSPIVPSFGSTPSIPTKPEINPIADNIVTSPALTSPEEITPETETTSVVSRFFGRFSTRSKSSSRDSIALSNDDLEFLADVPTADPHQESETGLDALSMMIKSPPLPTALPPPLKQPPRAPAAQISKIPNHNENTPDDFMSFFDSPFSSPLGTVPTPPVRSMLTQQTSSSSQTLPSGNLPPTTLGSNLPAPTIQTLTDQSWPSFDPSSTSSIMSKSPQTKRPFVAIMSSSSSRQSSSTPPLLPKPSSGFVLPPPPSTTRPSIGSDAGSTSNIPPLLPPPTSRTHTPQIAKPPTSASTIIDDDDDFADFLSSPTQTTQTNAPHSFGAFASANSGTAKQPSTQHTHSDDLFGNFDDSISPTPPQPPAKPVLQKKSPPPLSNELTNGTTRRTSRAADHARTLSLLESVAARGRWLAPPSPLPEALPPPEPNGMSSNGDLFSGSSMQAQQAQATASLRGTFPSPTPYSNTPLEKPSPWNFPPPTNNSPLPMIPNKQLVTHSTYPEKNSSASGGSKTGGLSAQDLSFFEGL